MASSSSSKKKGVAIAKRLKIDKAQRNMLIAVGGASVVLGVTVVMVAHLATTIKFNIAVMAANDEAISVYKDAQGSLEAVSSGIVGLSTNEYLESVARTRSEDCDAFVESLKKEEKENGPITSFDEDSIDMARECTALRVITDALPSTENIETAMTSFIYLLDNPTSLSLKGKEKYFGDLDFKTATYETGTGSKSVGDTPLNYFTISISYESRNGLEPFKYALKSMESSIRVFDASNINLSMEGGDEGPTMNTTFNTYYSGESSLKRVTKIVCANAKNEECQKKGGDGSVKVEADSNAESTEVNG